MTDPLPAVLLHMPTGSGKTRTAMHVICDHLRNTDGVVVWLANSHELLSQAAEEFLRSWRNLGNRAVQLVRYWGGVTKLPPIEDGLAVIGLQKFHALLGRAPSEALRLAARCRLVVVDEAHVSPARTYREAIQVLRQCPGTGLLGLSATPGRTWNDPAQDALVAELYREHKVTLTVEGHPNPVAYLIHEGYLADARFSVLRVDQGPARNASTPRAAGQRDYSPPDVQAATCTAQYVASVCRAVEGLRERHRRILVFTATVETAKVLARLLHVRGAFAEAVTADTPRGRREGLIRRFKSKDDRVRILINYGVLTTGFDAPATSAAVIARPTLSLVLYSQMVGRVIRGPLAGGNPTAEIVTVVDTTLPGFGDVAEAFMNWEDVW